MRGGASLAVSDKSKVVNIAKHRTTKKCRLAVERPTGLDPFDLDRTTHARGLHSLFIIDRLLRCRLTGPPTNAE